MVMGKSIEVSRREFSASELRALAVDRRDGAVVRRLLAIAMILEGQSRTEAARLAGMDRQTLCDWVHRYNEEGVAGLRSRVSPGRPPALTEGQMAELRGLVLDGPNPERNGVIRWRCADLRAEIIARWAVVLTERSVGRLLHRLGMARVQPRPYHPNKDAVAQEAFKKTSLAW
ncbi:MAG: helix-turn-helix domain-containing protein [Acetobacteraceae bacterium]